jgi:hypothetical protein
MFTFYTKVNSSLPDISFYSVRIVISLLLVDVKKHDIYQINNLQKKTSMLDKKRTLSKFPTQQLQ